MVLDDKNPWDDILASTMFALRATVHTTMQYTPAQSIFGRDSIINQRYGVNWETIRKQIKTLLIKAMTNSNKETRSYLKTRGKQNSIKTPK